MASPWITRCKIRRGPSHSERRACLVRGGGGSGKEGQAFGAHGKNHEAHKVFEVWLVMLILTMYSAHVGYWP